MNKQDGKHISKMGHQKQEIRKKKKGEETDAFWQGYLQNQNISEQLRDLWKLSSPTCAEVGHIVQDA